jgi:glycosyltransferase involved in cell wall biosynthesis
VTERHPRVVLLRMVDIGVDTRGKKVALSLARAGYDVTILSMSQGPETQEYVLGGEVRVVAVSVPFTRRDRERVARAARRQRSWRTVGFESAAEGVRHVARTYQRIEQARATGGGLAGRAQVAALRADVLLSRARTRGQQLSDDVVRTGWQAWDRTAPRVALLPSWRRSFPLVGDYEAAFGPWLDRLEPDVVHAHDLWALPVAASARDRAARAGRSVRLVYDARENWAGMPPEERAAPRLQAALLELEDEFVRQVDGVLTVSEPIADALVQRFRLDRRPVVLLNAPVARDRSTQTAGLRHYLKVPAETPLLVYSGAISDARGVDVLVRALGRLPEVHLAVVPVPFPHPAEAGLRSIAAEVGAVDRLHVVAPVDAEALVSFVADADVGVHPLRSGSPNHEMAMPNKLFEYLHAGLALVVSDVRSMAEVVRREHCGEVFRDGDPDDLARAVRAVLADPAAYRTGRADLVARLSWQGQEPALWAEYARVLGFVPSDPRQGSVPSLVLVPSDGA